MYHKKNLTFTIFQLTDKSNENRALFDFKKTRLEETWFKLF